jgi:frataxin-like iron-binding protein CyaY
LIRTITAVPIHTAKAPTLSVRIDVGRTIMLPFVPPRSITVPSVSYITLSDTMVPDHYIESALERKQRLKAEYEYTRDHIMTLPFRQASQIMFRGFEAAKRVFWRDGFIGVKVEGKGVLKLDKATGWALDDGRTIDRLFKLGV